MHAWENPIGNRYTSRQKDDVDYWMHLQTIHTINNNDLPYIGLLMMHSLLTWQKSHPWFVLVPRWPYTTSVWIIIFLLIWLMSDHIPVWSDITNCWPDIICMYCTCLCIVQSDIRLVSLQGKAAAMAYMHKHSYTAIQLYSYIATCMFSCRGAVTTNHSTEQCKL